MSSNSRTASLARTKLIIAMLIYGSVGIFTRYIPLPSTIIALGRGVIGFLLLALVLLAQRRMPDWAALRRRLLPLCLSGAFLGLNWALLFEAFRYTTVPRATVCYYLAPLFIVLVAPILFHERITKKKLLCLAAALAGMVLISGMIGGGSGANELRGLVLAVLSAVLYAAIVCLNKFLPDVPPIERTAFQLLVSNLVLLAFNGASGTFVGLTATGQTLALLAVVGVVHTGIAYVLYFSSIGELRAQTAAMLSYLDPVLSILLSALILQERLSPLELVGAVLVLGAAFLSEWQPARKNR